MALNVLGSSRISTNLNTPSAHPSPASKIEDTPEERRARHIHCTECNAPPTAPCVRIRWAGMNPICVERRHHARRLSDSEKVDERRERFNAAAQG